MNGSNPNRGCCHETVCPRAEIARFLDPDDPIEQRVQTAARMVADTCGRLSEPDLEFCFGSLYGLGNECMLFDLFRESYQTRRDINNGKRMIHAAGGRE
jgi:hypothetical protein